MKKKLIEMPVDLFKKIDWLATKHKRSVNKQINYLLEVATEIEENPKHNG